MLSGEVRRDEKWKKQRSTQHMHGYQQMRGRGRRGGGGMGEGKYSSTFESGDIISFEYDKHLKQKVIEGLPRTVCLLPYKVRNREVITLHHITEYLGSKNPLPSDLRALYLH